MAAEVDLRPQRAMNEYVIQRQHTKVDGFAGWTAKGPILHFVGGSLGWKKKDAYMKFYAARADLGQCT